VISTPLKPPPPNCTDEPFHSVGRLTWKRIGGALESTGAMKPVTLQYSGAAGTTARYDGSGPNGSSARVSGDRGMTSAESIVTPALGRPMLSAGIGSLNRVQSLPTL
jgi:hypothetical protein